MHYKWCLNETHQQDTAMAFDGYIGAEMDVYSKWRRQPDMQVRGSCSGGGKTHSVHLVFCEL